MDLVLKWEVKKCWKFFSFRLFPDIGRIRHFRQCSARNFWIHWFKRTMLEMQVRIKQTFWIKITNQLFKRLLRKNWSTLYVSFFYIEFHFLHEIRNFTVEILFNRFYFLLLNIKLKLIFSLTVLELHVNDAQLFQLPVQSHGQQIVKNQTVVTWFHKVCD